MPAIELVGLCNAGSLRGQGRGGGGDLVPDASTAEGSGAEIVQNGPIATSKFGDR